MKVGYMKIAAALLVLASVSTLAEQSVDENWDIDADATISIENTAGKIEIEGWNRNEAGLQLVCCCRISLLEPLEHLLLSQFVAIQQGRVGPVCPCLVNQDFGIRRELRDRFDNCSRWG